MLLVLGSANQVNCDHCKLILRCLMELINYTQEKILPFQSLKFAQKSFRKQYFNINNFWKNK